MKKKIEDWKHLFPFPQVRKEQEKAIDFIIESFLDKKKYVVAELGTGVGKSAIALTVSRWIHENSMALRKRGIIPNEVPAQSYVLTSQKILQDQYAKEFKGSIVDLRSSSNFKCKSITENTCGQTLRLRSAAKQCGEEAVNEIKKKANCIGGKGMGCPYRSRKEAFKSFPTGVTNFSYLLSEVTYVGELSKRALLICDEAHNIEDEVRKWATTTITENFAGTVLGMQMPWEDNKNLDSWLRKEYYPELVNYMNSLADSIQEYTQAGVKSGELEKIAKQYDIIDKHACSLGRYIQHKGSYADNFCFTWKETQSGQKSVDVKPIMIQSYAKDILYSRGHMNLMMSATILDKDTFMRSAGIPESEEVAFISIPSPFAVKNRPIHYLPVGSMSKAELENTLPKLADIVKELIEGHKNDKGIIHCHTFKIAQYLKQNIKTNRFIIHDSTNREEMLKKHLRSKKPTILLSPSMAEGVDLKNNLSRFQIICKIPYPYMGDPVVKAKMNLDQDWYTWLTAKTLIQSVGRSIRSHQDHAETYILDSGWNGFWWRNKRFFPNDFHRALKVKK